MDMIIDAQDAIAGRLSSLVAKELLKGKQIYIVNAEKAIISGNPKYTIKNFREKVERGDPYHGPFYPRRPDQMLKRFIRDMLPKKPRGTAAFKNLKVFLSVPEELKDKNLTRLEAAKNNLKSKYIDIGKLSETLGAKKTW